MAKARPKKGFYSQITDSCSRRGVSGISKGFILDLLPILLQFLQGCLKPKPEPTPQPATSKATPEAWKTADEAKAFALAKIKSGDPEDEDVEYKKTASNAAIREIRKKRRKSGDPLSRDEAEAYVLAHLDAARLGDMEENALKIQETQNS